MIRAFTPAILVGLISAFGHAQGSPATVNAASASDQTQVVEAMKTMYIAATQDDLAKFHTVAAPTFYAFDGGEPFSGDALMALIKKLHGAGKVFVWMVTDPEVHVDGETAWITFTNRGSVQDSTGTRSRTWLESAVLRKENGAWRILFFHSTPSPQNQTK